MKRDVKMNRRIVLAFLIYLLIIPSVLSCAPVNVPSSTASAYTGDNFTTWEDARLGVFIHWSHSSQQGVEVSWPLVGGTSTMPYCENMTVEQYQSSAATFNPQKWDPVAMAQLFKKTGIQYAVMTSKHHDGYAMYDTKLSDFSVMNSPVHKDLVRGYVNAMR
ncbi:MAG: hypothetical protein EHM12_05390, partial [Dehalococcoidia bacterium]